MKERFVFLSEERDFASVKREGTSGIFMKMPLKSAEEVKNAAECGLKVWIVADCSVETEVEYLTDFAGRVKPEPGRCRIVTRDSFEKLIAKSVSILEYVEGFIIPAPVFDMPVWDDSLGSYEDLYVLFDEYTEISPVRSWYYERAGQYIVSRYFAPVYALAKKVGKKISFDVGPGAIQYDFAKRMINPIRLINEGFSVVFREESAEIAAIAGLSRNGSFIINEEAAAGVRITHEISGGKILLIIPTRGIMERYAVPQKKMSVRPETPATVAAAEGVYYCDKLFRKGYMFTAVNEFVLENSAYCENGKLVISGERFDIALVCGACLFSEKGRDILNEAQNAGVRVNDGGLIAHLAEEDLEERTEWEK